MQCMYILKWFNANCVRSVQKCFEVVCAMKIYL
jgi:hypothetical protein